MDDQGNIYVADTLNNRIRRISPAGMVTAVAGSGPGTVYGFDGDLVERARPVRPRIWGCRLLLK